MSNVGVQTSDLENVSLIGLFPKMRRLTVHNYYPKTNDFTCIARYIPNVEHLEMSTDFVESMDKSVGILKLNPHLISLAVPLYSNITVLQSISEILPNLQELKFSVSHVLYAFQTFRNYNGNVLKLALGTTVSKKSHFHFIN